jgi:uncharacterized protein
MVAKLLLAMIWVYQVTLSRLILAAMGPVCRFEPSCSRYAAACILDHGALRGSLLSLKRLCRCHPFHPGGFDPPPPPPLRRGTAAWAPEPRPVAAADSMRGSPTGKKLSAHAE